MGRVRNILQTTRTNNVEISLATRGTHGKLRPQRQQHRNFMESCLALAQLRMQHGKLESCLQGSCHEANGRQANRWWSVSKIGTSQRLARSTRDGGASSLGILSHGGSLLIVEELSGASEHDASWNTKSSLVTYDMSGASEHDGSWSPKSWWKAYGKSCASLAAAVAVCHS